MTVPREFGNDWTGTCFEMAQTMWKVVHDYAWKADEFSSLFDRVYSNADDVDTLWQLAGATNDYLRLGLGSFPVPVELPKRLLSSDHLEARVIGLKLYGRCPVREDDVIAKIIEALNRPEEYEQYGGFYEAGNLVERCRISGARLSRDSVEPLVAAITTFVDGRDDNDQRASRHRIECLRSLCD